MIHSKFPCMHSFSTSDVIGVHENNDSYVFKKFINAAIYVEKTIKKLPDHTLISTDDNMKIKKTKICTCISDANSCSFHLSMQSGDGIKYTKSDNIMNLNCTNGNLHQQLNGKSNDKLIEIRERQRAINTRRIVSAHSVRTNYEQSETRDRSKYFDRKLENLEEEVTPKSVPSETQLADTNNISSQRNIQKVEQNIAVPTKKIDDVLPRSNQPQNKKIDAIKEVKENTDNESTSSSSSSSTLTDNTVKKIDNYKNGTKISLSSMTTCRLSESESVKQWLIRKIEEQKIRRMNAMNEKKRKEIERQKILEKERENFKLWLAEKKKIEEKQKAQLKKQQELESLRLCELEKKQLESRIQYEKWFQKKREQEVAKENEEHRKAIQDRINRDKRMRTNQGVFEEWLKSAKNKPTPIPLNRGLDSLRSSVSVTYINPVPWVPNIAPKPASQ